MTGLDFLLSLEDSMSGPATAAESALAKLERQIKQEGQSLSELEAKLSEASAELARLGEGSVDPKIVAQIESQTEAVAALEAQLKEATETIGIMSQAHVAPEDMAKAEKQVESLTAKLSDAKDKLEALKSKGGPSVNVDAFKKQESLVSGLKKEIATRKEGLGVLQGAMPKFQKAAAESKSSLEGILGAAQQSGGGLGMLAGKASQLSGMIGKAGAAGAVLMLVAVLIAVVGAAFAASAALTHFALKAADAARSARLLSDAAAASSKGGGKELEMVIDQIAAKSPLARDRIAEIGRALELAGLSGRRMQVALEMIAMIESAVPGAGQKIQSLAEQFQKVKRAVLTKADLAGTGLAIEDVAKQLAESLHTTEAAAKQMLQNGTASVDKVLDAMNRAIEKKFGKTVASQMLSLVTQFDKLKENIGRLFADINIEPFLEGLKSITDLFSQNTFTGMALKKVITEAFNAIFGASSSVFPIIKAFIQGVIIALLTFYLQLKRAAKFFDEAFGGGKTKIDWIKVAMYAGIAAVILFGTVIGAIAATIAILIGSMMFFALIIALPFILPVVAIIALIVLLNRLGSAIADALGIDLSGSGGNLIQGLIDGIAAKIPEAIATIVGLAGSLKDALTAALGIHSPSTVFKSYGEFTAEGFSQGVDAKADDAGDAIANLGAGKPGTPGKASGKSKGERPSINVVINIYGAKIDDGILAQLREAVHDIFEQEAAGAFT